MHPNISDILSEIGKTPIDKKLIPQEKLDLVNKNRTSLFPWRGQFSPQLIEALLENYAADDTMVLDPFMGSGTTLFETSRKSLPCLGLDVNPAAVEIARTVHFANLPSDQPTLLAKPISRRDF